MDSEMSVLETTSTDKYPSTADVYATNHSLASVKDERSRTALSCRKLQEKGRKNDIFVLYKKRTEKARGEFVFKICRLVNRRDK